MPFLPCTENCVPVQGIHTWASRLREPTKRVQQEGRGLFKEIPLSLLMKIQFSGVHLLHPHRQLRVASRGWWGSLETPSTLISQMPHVFHVLSAPGISGIGVFSTKLIISSVLKYRSMCCCCLASGISLFW